MCETWSHLPSLPSRDTMRGCNRTTGRPEHSPGVVRTQAATHMDECRSRGSPPQEFDPLGTLNAQGVIAYERGEMVQAAERFTEALDHYRTLRYAFGMGWALINLAKVARAQGDYSGAARDSTGRVLRCAGPKARNSTSPGACAGSPSIAAVGASIRARSSPLWGGGGSAAAIGAPVHGTCPVRTGGRQSPGGLGGRVRRHGRRGGRCPSSRRSRGAGGGPEEGSAPMRLARSRRQRHGTG